MITKNKMNVTNKIKILSTEQAIKIAAGEVVERPVNIIKELLENSIDAQATKITIIVHQSGKMLIKIIDNGSGMTADDAKLSVAQHATSKITSVDDLETIATFGFRGEALASINSVSNLTITTKTDEAQTGTSIKWSFGKLQEESMESHPTGTTLEIANLFDNIPARKKFLKKNETEWRAIITLFQAFCLDYCNIHFQLYNEEKLQFNCPAVTNIGDRSAQLFDNNLQSQTLNLIDLENKLCSVTGVISTPNYYRYDRNQIFIFVNNRWIKNIDLTKAIMRGYTGTLPVQKFPAAIIFIKIDQDQVDVNIHPKKEEVKFLHPKKVETIITNSIKATLEESINQQIEPVSTQFSTESIENTKERPAPFSFLQESESLQQNYETPVSYSVQVQTPTHNHSDAIPAEEFMDNSNEKINQKIDYKETINSFVAPISAAHAFENSSTSEQDQFIAPQNEQTHIVVDTETEISIIGQYKLTYILFEKNNNLVFIDQHAAHERVLYEQFKVNFSNIPKIQLIFPEFIKLEAHDILAITPYFTLLKDHGIDAEIFSDTQLIIQAMPIHLKNQLMQETIQQIVGWIHEINETDSARIINILNEKIHTKMACSAAIKAGDKLNNEQMQQLLKKLRITDNRFSCPHGRPTSWILPIDQLEKKFKRDYGKKSEQFHDFL